MANELAIVYGGASFVSVVVYAVVGRRLSQRAVASPSQLARDQFSLFWYGLAVLTLFGGLESLLAAVGAFSLDLDLLFLDLTLLGFCVAFWGLVGYLVFLYTGRYYLVPLSALYALAYVLLLDYVITAAPSGFMLTGGRVVTVYGPAPGSSLTAVLVVILIVPEFLGAFAYLSLLARTRDRTLRFRISVVGLSLLAWFGTALIPIPSGSGGIAWGLAHPLVGAVAACLILVAYYPPAWVRSKLRVLSIEERPLGTGAELRDDEPTGPSSSGLPKSA